MEINLTCPQCSKQAITSVGQSIVNGILRWYRSSHCPHCKWAEELDGVGKPPHDIRKLILSDQGEWALRFDGVFDVAFLKLARSSLGLSMLELRQLRDKSFITQGTLVEMQFIQNTFHDAGFELRLLLIRD